MFLAIEYENNVEYNTLEEKILRELESEPRCIYETFKMAEE